LTPPAEEVDLREAVDQAVLAAPAEKVEAVMVPAAVAMAVPRVLQVRQVIRVKQAATDNPENERPEPHLN
jgi:hypothetical protein